jgi:hypothetical protein
MLGMFTPSVIEAPLALEPVTTDPFVADLDHRSIESDIRLAAFFERNASTPRRQIFD